MLRVPEHTNGNVPMTYMQRPQILASPHKVPRGEQGLGYPFLIPRVSVQFLKPREPPTPPHHKPLVEATGVSRANELPTLSWSG
jgi:hypothetical protein